MRVEILGSPIAGEDRREREWRDAIAAQVPAGAQGYTGVVLAFRLEPGRRRIDVDNLARPALDALRDAGSFRRGFPDLDALVAVKRAQPPAGLTVVLTSADEVRHLAAPLTATWSVSAPNLPRGGDATSQAAWRDAVTASWSGAPLSKNPIAVDVAVRTTASLKDLLKPVLDGLEAVLGRDPVAHLEFAPNDDRITWLRIARAEQGPVLSMTVRA